MVVLLFQLEIADGKTSEKTVCHVLI
jgi:hypothetical protein